MKYITTLLTLVFTAITACHATPITTLGDDTIHIESAPFLPVDFRNEKVNIFIDGMYRGSEPSEFTPMLQEDWYDFYKDESTGKFILDKAQITVVKEYDDCLGDSTTFVRSRDAIIMIKGIVPKSKTINSFTTEKTALAPGEKLSFTFNNTEYTLKADGIYTDENNVYVIDGYPAERFHNEVINYKLYLYTKDKKQLLISVPRFNDTFVQILFIGDLNEDGKPDFIFDTSRDYEEKRVTLFLSYPAKDTEIVIPTDEASYQFDC